jgi:hypothetical protein
VVFSKAGEAVYSNKNTCLYKSENFTRIVDNLGKRLYLIESGCGHLFIDRLKRLFRGEKQGCFQRSANKPTYPTGSALYVEYRAVFVGAYRGCGIGVIKPADLDDEVMQARYYPVQTYLVSACLNLLV